MQTDSLKRRLFFWWIFLCLVGTPFILQLAHKSDWSYQFLYNQHISHTVDLESYRTELASGSRPFVAAYFSVLAIVFYLFFHKLKRKGGNSDTGAKQETKPETPQSFERLWPLFLGLIFAVGVLYSLPVIIKTVLTPIWGY